MTDPIDAGKHFDQAVRATAAYGELATAVTDIRGDIIEVKVAALAVQKDVQHIRSGMDKWGGAIVVVGALVSLATSIVAIVAGRFILSALGFTG